MSKKSIWVDVDLDDIDTDDLLEELEYRPLGQREKNILLSIIEAEDPKIKLFMQVMGRYSLRELEGLLSEKYEHSVLPKNQLRLL